MYSGLVKWFDPYKGYGFIVYDNDKEVFAHFTGIQQEGFKTLKEGQEVTFDLTEGSRGIQATNIVPKEDQ